jgi:hypothetical protein
LSSWSGRLNLVSSSLRSAVGRHRPRTLDRLVHSADRVDLTVDSLRQTRAGSPRLALAGPASRTPGAAALRTRTEAGRREGN